MSQQEKPATHCGLFFRFEFYEKTRLGVICTETVQKLERTMRNAKKIVKFWTLMSLALSVTALTANAQIYKSVDENGVVTFSDTPQTGNLWTLSYVLRGPHTLQVRRLSSSGETASESEVITVFVLRPSVLKAAPR